MASITTKIDYSLEPLSKPSTVNLHLVGIMTFIAPTKLKTTTTSLSPSPHQSRAVLYRTGCLAGGLAMSLCLTLVAGEATAHHDPGHEGIFIRSNAKTSKGSFNFTKIADSSDLFSGFGLPAINDEGTVAFQAYSNSGSTGIFTGSGGATTTIASNSGSFDFFGDPTINDEGTVAFLAGLDSGGSGIFTGSGGATTTIADTDNPFSGFGFGGPAINNSGTVAFLAELDGQLSQPFPYHKVVDPGDSLLGSRVTTLFFGGDGLNDLGQLVFGAEFADGTQAIFRADPKPVPEPTSTLGILVGALGGWSLLKRKKN